MTTHHDVRCPACRKRVRLAPGFLDKRVACPYCKHVFQPSANDVKAPSPGPSAAALRDQIGRLEAELAQARADGEQEARRGREESARLEEQLRAAEAQAAGLRDKLAASQAACRQAAEQMEALRIERDALIEQCEAAKGHVARLGAMIKSCGIALD